jgi:hypothetical protein
MSKKTFSRIWETLDTLVDEGGLISNSEILDELKDDDISALGKAHKDAFRPLTYEVQKKTTEILAKYPDMIKITTRGSSNADPFLIATAILEDGIIVTDEGPNGIQRICNLEGVSWMNLNSFLNEILE